jgi:ferredoxin
MYKVEIDRSLCSGYGTCIELAPDVFELDDGGTAFTRVGETPNEAVLEAVSACPMGALSAHRVDG